MNLRGTFTHRCARAASRFAPSSPSGYPIPVERPRGRSCCARRAGTTCGRRTSTSWSTSRASRRSSRSSIRSDDPNLETDVQFGVTQRAGRASTCGTRPASPRPTPTSQGRWYSLEHVFVVEPGEAALPQPPIAARRAASGRRSWCWSASPEPPAQYAAVRGVHSFSDDVHSVVHRASEPGSPMIVHLIDGTYELFRHFYGAAAVHQGRGPAVRRRRRRAAARCSQMIEQGATHVGVATDHVIESFRNDLWPGYKTGDGIEPALWAQFHPLEEALAAMGVAVWPMVELEADDALAVGRAARRGRRRACREGLHLDARQGPRAVRARRPRRAGRPQAASRSATTAACARSSASSRRCIPDYPRARRRRGRRLSGHPGHRRGRRGAARSNRHGPIEDFPARGARRASASSRCCSRTSRRCAPTRRCSTTSRQLRWRGPTPAFAAWAERMNAPRLAQRAAAAATRAASS